MKKNKILIGTRASKLALIYANRAKDEILMMLYNKRKMIPDFGKGEWKQEIHD